jgi:hypothetical protein
MSGRELIFLRLLPFSLAAKTLLEAAGGYEIPLMGCSGGRLHLQTVPVDLLIT